MSVYLSSPSCPSFIHLLHSLLSADLLPTDGAAEIQSTRLSCAMAIVRFINGMVDPLQTGVYLGTFSYCKLTGQDHMHARYRTLLLRSKYLNLLSRSVIELHMKTFPLYPFSSRLYTRRSNISTNIPSCRPWLPPRRTRYNDRFAQKT